MMTLGLLGITLTGWLALTVAVSTGVIAAVMFMLGSERLHYVWGAFCVAVCIWIGAFFFVTQSTDTADAYFWWKIAYVGIILIPITYFHFVLELTNKARMWNVLVLYVFAGVFISLHLASRLIVDDLTFLFDEMYYNYPAAMLHPYFLVLFIALPVFAHYLGYVAYRDSTDELFKKRTRLFFGATGVSFIGATMNFFSVYGIFIHPATNFTVIVAPPIIAYAMLKYRLFNIGVVIAQLLTFVIVAFAVFRLAVSGSPQEILFNLIMLLVTGAVSVYLIKSVRREVEQRQEIQLLADNLKVANDRLKELDTLKSQFLSIATHELRTPITIVRNFVSLMLDGTYGKVPPAAEVAARQVLERATDMAQSVDSYLNVSRIEQGKMQYTFATVDITRLTKFAVDGMKANAEKKSLTLTLTTKPGAESMQANADGPKISEVLVNLIDNSIKYTPKGSVAVTVEKIGKVGRVTLRDTGVGMTPKTLQGLFKLFSPGEDAKKINVSSTGIGMYISKMHVEAHKGALKGYSEGEGKGSQFVLDLPLLS